MQDKSQLKIIAASGNEGKIAEIKQILRDFEVVSMKEIGICVDPQESADNFLGNVLIKATALQDSLIEHGYEEFLVLADDSGICIEALDDEPGIFSARYANIEKGILENASDEENRACVVERLHARNISSSLARFVACVVLIGRVRLRDEMIDLNLQASGECRGMIYDNEKGENGFGYDSMFQPEGYNVRMAELDSEEKNLISHRAKALRALSLELDSKLK